MGAAAHALGVGATELLRPVTPDRRLVTLVGMRGAGKSTVGRALADRLGLEYESGDEQHRSQCEGRELHGFGLHITDPRK